MRFLTGLFAVIAVSAGCEGLPLARLVSIKPWLADRDAVAKALPKDLTLGQVVEASGRCAGNGKDKNSDYENPITLEEKLASVRARVGQDGKLYDWAGKEIYFEHIIKYGCQRHFSEQEQEASRKLFETYQVISIDDDPGGLSPV